MINTFVNQLLPVIQLFPLFSDNYHDLFDWMDPYLRVNALWTRDNIVQWSKLPPCSRCDLGIDTGHLALEVSPAGRRGRRCLDETGHGLDCTSSG